MERKKRLNPWVREVCKIGQGAACCKYLVAGPNGFECMKIDPANKAVIEKAWVRDAHVSQGDNCVGTNLQVWKKVIYPYGNN